MTAPTTGSPAGRAARRLLTEAVGAREGYRGWEVITAPRRGAGSGGHP